MQCKQLQLTDSLNNYAVARFSNKEYEDHLCKNTLSLARTGSGVSVNAPAELEIGKSRNHSLYTVIILFVQRQLDSIPAVPTTMHMA